MTVKQLKAKYQRATRAVIEMHRSMWQGYEPDASDTAARDKLREARSSVAKAQSLLDDIYKPKIAELVMAEWRKETYK